MRAVSLLAFVALSGCVFGLGPLPAEVEDLSEYLERRSFRLVPSNVSYDRAFENVVPDAHAVTYEVTLVDPPPGSGRAFLDVFRFASEADVEGAVAGLRRIHGTGDIYVDGPLVVYVRGGIPDLEIALVRRFGTPLTA